jgi:hypothetical protein
MMWSRGVRAEMQGRWLIPSDVLENFLIRSTSLILTVFPHPMLRRQFHRRTGSWGVRGNGTSLCRDVSNGTASW